MDFVYSAVEQARKSPCYMMHGAVIVLNGKVVARGYNYYHSVSELELIDTKFRYKMSVHAERMAINDFLKRYRKTELMNADIYVVRISNDDMLKNSHPCPTCERVIKKYRIRTAYYSTEMTSINLI
jgi:tRNA(Arg) A34 adenosine deaminase TadA